MNAPSTRVAIIGGGYAGMAAAVSLAKERIPVTVFEAGPVLGGRARRIEFQDQALDNGLHILIGAYHETLRLIRLVNPLGEKALWRTPLQWHMHEGFQMRAPNLPAPMHLIAGLCLAQGVSVTERLKMLLMMRKLHQSRYQCDSALSVTQWLKIHQQGEQLTRDLWNPLCVAALNTPADKASAQTFAHVLGASLGQTASDSDLLISKTDLSALFPEPAAQFIQQHSGQVFTHHRIERLECRGQDFFLHFKEKNDQKDPVPHQFSHVICALAPQQVNRLLPEVPSLQGTRDLIEAFDYQPITSVYLQFTAPLPVRLPCPMTGLVQGPAHWLFDRQTLCGQKGLIGAVISAEGAHDHLAQAALAQSVHDQIQSHWGPLPPLLWHKVVTEKRATFSAVPKLQRPTQKTEWPHLWLAGDYTQSPYPATLESAVQSGIACAQGIRQSLSRAL